LGSRDIEIICSESRGRCREVSFGEQMNADKISEKDLANLLTQLGRVNGDKDRIRLINGVFSSPSPLPALT
jgi:hypothetical protein